MWRWLVVSHRLLAEDVIVHEGRWGSWKAWRGTDLPGYYACGARLKFENTTGVLDNTAANGVELDFCNLTDWSDETKETHIIYDGAYGDWRPLDGSVMCDKGSFINGAQVRYQSYQGVFGDDTALNGLKIHCKNRLTGIEEWKTVYEGMWGEWLSPQVVQDMYVMEARVQYEDSGAVDSTGMNGLQFRFVNPDEKDNNKKNHDDNNDDDDDEQKPNNDSDGDSSEDEGKSSTGAIVGAVVGIVVGVAVTFAALLLVRRHRRQNRKLQGPIVAASAVSETMVEAVLVEEDEGESTQDGDGSSDFSAHEGQEVFADRVVPPGAEDADRAASPGPAVDENIPSTATPAGGRQSVVRRTFRGRGTRKTVVSSLLLTGETRERTKRIVEGRGRTKDPNQKLKVSEHIESAAAATESAAASNKNEFERGVPEGPEVAGTRDVDRFCSFSEGP